MVPWNDFHGRVAKILNMHPDNLQLQYKFSNEPPKALPFNLNSPELYENMLKRFEPHAIANNKRKGLRKEVRVDVFHKDATGEGKSGGKPAKVRIFLLHLRSSSDLTI